MAMSCGEDRTYQYDEITKGNRQIEELMGEYYLWTEQMNTDIGWKDYFGDGSKFFQKLLPNTDKWSYCTIDTIPQDKFERGYFNHLDTYGMDFDLMNDPTGTTTRQFARVLFVAFGSQADKAGLKRGDFISFVDGARVSSSTAKKLVSGDSLSLTVSHIDYNLEEELLFWADTTELKMGKSSYVENYPFYVNEVFDFLSRRVAYLMVTRLIEGPYETDPTSTKYLDDMDAIFAEYKAAGVNEFIVDLRYCNRGEIEMAQRLASYIAAYNHADEVFAKTIWRDDLSQNNMTYPYDLSLTHGNALDLDRVVFITSDYTRGVAEWLIRSLVCTMGADNIIIVGKQTAGQNVWTKGFPTEYSMTLYPAVAYVTDAEGEWDYSSIVPTDYNDESTNVNMYEYGSLGEILLLKSLYDLFNLGEE